MSNREPLHGEAGVLRQHGDPDILDVAVIAPELQRDAALAKRAGVGLERLRLHLYDGDVLLAGKFRGVPDLQVSGRGGGKFRREVALGRGRTRTGQRASRVSPNLCRGNGEMQRFRSAVDLDDGCHQGCGTGEEHHWQGELQEARLVQRLGVGLHVVKSESASEAQGNLRDWHSWFRDRLLACHTRRAWFHLSASTQ